MVILDITCHARIHESEWARTHGCVCPVAWGEPLRKPARPHAQRTYIRGSVANLRGPRRQTVSEPDWVAVERRAAGDRSLTLATVEREAAIDRLDDYGLSAAQVAIRLGVTQRTVTRRRAQRRQIGVAS